MKDAYYFSHDSNARVDPKILAMRGVYGAAGYGWYWILIEMMRDEGTHKLGMQSKYAFHAFASQMQCEPQISEQFIKDCINEFSLFKSDESHFWSESLLRRMTRKEEKSEKARKSAEARWGKNAASNKGSPDGINETQCDGDANASKNDAIKESKVKESKENKSKENKSKELKPKDTPSRQLKYAEDSPYYQLAQYLFLKIKKWTEALNVQHALANTNIQTWASDMRKLVEINKAPEDEIRKVIDWATADEFWQGNILSAGKLRLQYAKLLVEMAKGSRPRNQSRNPTRYQNQKRELQVVPSYQKPDNNKGRDEYRLALDRARAGSGQAPISDDEFESKWNERVAKMVGAI
ncbi:DUF4373 domain-containing protein [Paenibacillus sp. WQ 127069]|uniref:DUF4373 domain-containing protein n=1 Tax=Paenibacillus baimaensis TaxID=2982185 RepID=A0ABT2UVI6_9BACL|nr:DUF4373 domain-containing protein [Paenibacillus sp. WQ 127069]MCU6798026.1 DUF4373 domain-containing protein [Paenibacillus sp. WQ 127069]